ncbi:MAG: type III pantothenate kinase [Kistimonas sp.]|nr:type III pantothenate kinase [Kistimonas sp.]
MNILDMDAGNTRVKWRLSQDGRPVSSGALFNDSDARLVDALADSLGTARVDVCRLSSVRKECIVHSLVEALADRLGVMPQLPEPCASLGGLVVEGVEPVRLGCDRWLAMLGAVQLYPKRDVLIVDAGTAMTLDCVNSRGVFVGGLICPGLYMLRQSLRRSLDRVTLSPQADLGQPALARQSTSSAENGILCMALALVEREFSRLGSNAVLVLCGGDAPFLKKHLQSSARLHPDLVFQGLGIANPVCASECTS